MKRHRIALGLAIVIVAVASLAPVGPIAGGSDATDLPGLEARDVELTLRFEVVPLANILEALSRAADFRVEVKDDLIMPATIEVEKVPLREVLGALAARYGLKYEVPDARTLVVRASTPKISDGVTPPELLSKTQPAYPDSARAAGRQDKVIVTAIIQADGAVGEVSILKHAVDPAFDESAMAAVKQWRYRPAMKDGKPVEVVFQVVIDFRLDKKPSEEVVVKDHPLS